MSAANPAASHQALHGDSSTTGTSYGVEDSGASRHVAGSSKVVIVGGGVIGSSIAYFLRASDPTVSVTVIERDPTYARSSSALSAASIRQQFSTPLSIRMSLFGIEFLRSIGERLEIDGTKPSIDLHEGGYLFLATSAGEPTSARKSCVAEKPWRRHQSARQGRTAGALSLGSIPRI
jgi:glycine/D-amino acid oxidase-like deaminating enzyme